VRASKWSSLKAWVKRRNGSTASVPKPLIMRTSALPPIGVGHEYNDTLAIERSGGPDGGAPPMSIRPINRNRRPWNKGLLIGQKRRLEPKHVWSIRVRLEIARSRRDLAIFNLAIDSKLRACDLVKLRVDEICSGANVRRRATTVQKKTDLCNVTGERQDASSTLRSFLERWTSLASGIIHILNHDSRSKKSGY
jgi:hypothetical protein